MKKLKKVEGKGHGVDKGISIYLKNKYQVNLIHGLLVDEEIRLKEKIPILLAEFDYDFDNTKAYVEEVKKLRRMFTQIDGGEDYLGVFSRIEDYRLDKEE